MPQFIEADVIQKIATPAEWATLLGTKIPYKGQIMLVSDGTGKVINIKVGDGTNNFASLTYMFDTIQANVNYVEVTGTALPTPTITSGFSVVGEGTYTRSGQPDVVVPAGSLGILGWNGTAWSLVSSMPLPTTPVSDEIIEGGTTAVSQDGVFKGTVKPSDLDKVVISKNKFDYTKVGTVARYVHPNTGIMTAAPGSNYRAIDNVQTGPNIVTMGGFGTQHYGIGWAFVNTAGAVVRNGVSAINADKITVDGTGLPTDVVLQTTVKTSDPGDNTNIQNIQIEIGSVPTSFEPYQEAIEKITETDLTVKAVNTVGSESKSPVNVGFFNSNALKNGDLTLKGGIGKNKFNYAEVQNDSFIHPTTGILTNAPGSNYKTSPHIPIEEGETDTVSGHSNIHYALGYAFYNAAGVLVANGASAQDVQSFSATAPVGLGIKTWRYTVTTNKVGDNTNIENIQVEVGNTPTSFEPYKYGASEVKGYPFIASNPAEAAKVKTWGLKVLFLGDSITSEDNGLSNWPKYFRSIAGITDFRNYARSGASFTDWAYDNHPRQQLSEQIAAAIADGYIPDMIILAIGTNDYNKLATLGTYETAMGKATLSDLDRTKVLEAARYAFWKIRDQWPKAKCFYANPLQKATITVDQTIANDFGNWLRIPVERIATFYTWIIINQYGRSGVSKQFEASGGPGQYLYDGVHTNEDGKKVQGTFMASEVTMTY